MAVTTAVRMDIAAVGRILHTDPRADALVAEKAKLLVVTAVSVFEAAQRHDNEARTSEFSPPNYVDSFGVRKVPKADGVKWIAYNDDPSAHLVEYGAHAGGETFVLRYKPLTRALEIVGGAE